MTLLSVYKTYLRRLEAIDKKHNGFTDSEVRERLALCINWYFIYGNPVDQDFPTNFEMLSESADAELRKATRSFLLKAQVLSDHLKVGFERFEFIENTEIASKSGKRYYSQYLTYNEMIPPTKPPVDRCNYTCVNNLKAAEDQPWELPDSIKKTIGKKSPQDYLLSVLTNYYQHPSRKCTGGNMCFEGAFVKADGREPECVSVKLSRRASDHELPLYRHDSTIDSFYFDADLKLRVDLIKDTIQSSEPECANQCSNIFFAGTVRLTKKSAGVEESSVVSQIAINNRVGYTFQLAVNLAVSEFNLLINAIMERFALCCLNYVMY